MNITTDNSAVIAALNDRIAELEKEKLPNEHGTNRYGVDVSYFRKTINRELNRDLSNFKPDELARVLARLSVTADKQVVHEDEFAKSHNLEQQALACDWIYKNVPDLSNGNYMVIQNRARQLRIKAKALKEQGK